MASNSGWSTEVPSGSSSVAKGDDDIRSFKSFMDAWIKQEHYTTDGSSSSAGIAKHGAGRAFVGTASQLSNPTADNDGRLFFVTDTNVLRIGNVSTSSWSVVADNVTLSSDNSWTGTNSFTTAFALLPAFSEVVSYASTLAGTGVLMTNAATLPVLNVGSKLTYGDRIVPAFKDTVGSGLLCTASVNSSTASVTFYFYNPTVSVTTITELSYLGFPST